MPDISELTVDQRLSLSTAARHLAREFDGVFREETIELFLATSYDQFADRAKFNHFLPLMAERFARQRLEALAKVEGKATDGLPVVLFLCVHNAGRSQMALGWLQRLAGGRAVAWSGGSEPGLEVNPAAVEAMAEVSIDITEEFPKPWTDEIVRAADVVITMGCGDACPIFPGKRYEDWPLEDPAGTGRRSRPADPGRDRATGPNPPRLAGRPGRAEHARPMTAVHVADRGARRAPARRRAHRRTVRVDLMTVRIAPACEHPSRLRPRSRRWSPRVAGRRSRPAKACRQSR